LSGGHRSRKDKKGKKGRKERKKEEKGRKGGKGRRAGGQEGRRAGGQRRTKQRKDRDEHVRIYRYQYYTRVFTVYRNISIGCTV